MVFIVCGLNHKTAPLPLREKIAFSQSLQESLIADLLESTCTQEAFMLITCNRTEIYCDTKDPESIPLWLAKTHKIDPELLLPHLYLYTEDEGIAHALKVSTGLDSMMLGEPQILGQMKQAFFHACQLGTVQTRLRPVFEYIFRASKRIRTQSGIGNHPVSIAYAGVQLISQHFKHLENLQVFLIGSGETATLVARYLFKQGVKNFMVASRSEEKAQYLAAQFSGQALSIMDIPHYLSKADVIISATTCPLPFIDHTMVKHALALRPDKPMFMLDLAVPRDIEANVGQLPKVHLYNVDDLQNRIEQGMDERKQAALNAELLIHQALEKYQCQNRGLQAKALICNYREHMQNLANPELQKALQRLSMGEDHTEVLKEFSRKLVNKLLHLPSAGLRQMAKDGHESSLTLAQSLLNLSINRHIDEEIS